MSKEYRIQEIFDSVQGEGSYMGLLVRFVRFGGCDYSLRVCPFCDSARASDNSKHSQWKTYTHEHLLSICQEAVSEGRGLIMTGGNPLLQWQPSAMAELAPHLHIETQGSIPLEGRVKHLVVSPKVDSIRAVGESALWNQHKAFWEKLDQSQYDSLDIKFPAELQHVALYKEYLDWWMGEFGLGHKANKVRFILTVRNDLTKDYKELCKTMYEQIKPLFKSHVVLIQPQVHVLIWGNKEGV